LKIINHTAMVTEHYSQMNLSILPMGILMYITFNIFKLSLALVRPSSTKVTFEKTSPNLSKCWDDGFTRTYCVVS